MTDHVKAHNSVSIWKLNELTRNLVSASSVIVSESETGYLHVNHLKLEEQTLGERVVWAKHD
jgi:hypothetical protein